MRRSETIPDEIQENADRLMQILLQVSIQLDFATPHAIVLAAAKWMCHSMATFDEEDRPLLKQATLELIDEILPIYVKEYEEFKTERLLKAKPEGHA